MWGFKIDFWGANFYGYICADTVLQSVISLTPCYILKILTVNLKTKYSKFLWEYYQLFVY